jgi:hypothetical protein
MVTMIWPVTRMNQGLIRGRLSSVQRGPGANPAPYKTESETLLSMVCGAGQSCPSCAKAKNSSILPP